MNEGWYTEYTNEELDAKLKAFESAQQKAIDAAWALPDDVAYWAGIRLGCYASQGRYSKDSPTTMLFIEVLKRWDAYRAGLGDPEKGNTNDETDDESFGVESSHGVSEASG